MNPETQALYIQLVKAGRFDDAAKLKAAYEPLQGQRTRGELGERGELLARAKRIGMTREDLFGDTRESALSKFVADMGYGFESMGLGINQLGQHIMPGRNTTDIDERVREHRREYEQTGLADEVTGGQFAANVIPAIAGGILGRTALAARPLLTSSAIGGAEEAIQPVEGNNYWTEKGKDVAIGSTIGLATEGIPTTAIRSAEMAADLPGKAYRKVQGREPGEEPGWFVGGSAETDDIMKVREISGIDFTPGQVTQAPGVQQLEELARTGLFTSKKVKKADEARAGQYDDFIQSYRDSLGESVPIDTMTQKLQSWGRERANELIQKRRDAADKDYAVVRNYADGQPIIPADNYRNALDRIIRNGQTAGASEDMVAAAKQAEARLDRLEGQGGYLSGADIEILTRAGDGKFTGSPFDLKDFGYGDALAADLSQAAMEDAFGVPGLVKPLKEAKANYARHSSHIDEFESGLLGKTLGKEFQSAVDDSISNGVAPEQLMQKFRTESPTKITQAFKHIESKSPELANQFRASFLERARQAATFRSSAGGPDTTFDPATFLRNLGITGSGEKGMQGLERLRVLFPDNPDAVHALYRAGLILGDKSMTNTSRSGVTTIAKEVLDTATAFITGAVQKIAGTLGSAAGLNTVARSMDINQGFRVAPQPVVYGGVRRVQNRARVPALGVTTGVETDNGDIRF